MAPYEAFGDVKTAILNRLSSTAAPMEDRTVIARYLASQVGRLPLEAGRPVPPEEILPLEMCAEGGGQLYVCAWREDSGPVTLYHQTASGRRVWREYHLDQGEACLDAARWLLEEAVSPSRFDLSRLRELPRNIYFTPNGGSEEHLQRPDLQEAAMEDL